MAEQIAVAVVFACAPGHEEVVNLYVREGATLRQVVEASGLSARYPDTDFRTARIGVWGKLVSPEAAVNAFDRVEVYRPLLVDPKIARSRRAGKKISARRASGT